MPKQLPKAAEPVLLDLEQFVLHAAVDFEYHWFFASQETFLRHQDIFSTWDFWYVSSRENSWAAAVVALSKFYETNPHSSNVNYLMDLLASDSRADWNSELSAMRTFLAQSQQTATDVTIIRSNYTVHKNRHLSFEDTYGKTKSKWNDVRILIENSRLALNVIVKAINGREIITTEPARRTREDLMEIADRLGKSRLTKP